MPLPPQLTPDQRKAALAKAGAARRQRAELKDKLKMGSLTLRELFDQAERDEVVGKMKVLTVLGTVALPAIVISGFYGMNTKNLPGIESPHGSEIAIGLMAAATVAVLVLLKKFDYL